AAHPAVLEVGVAGVQDSTRGEIVKAWVVLKSGHATSAAELRSWCQERLPSYKLPARIEFRTELPKSNVGKVLRRELAREVRSTQEDAASPDA
ncbi:MAG TPA: hypothetical protein VFH29_05020, partial [Anaerolineales bacterium]|nr:hypothetical protein [Anaerolineales bacterium]